MKLRVRVRRQTSRLELPEEQLTLAALADLIRQTLLRSHGVSPDTDFGLSLNGSDLLSDCGQTLAACGVDAGDLIWVLLPPSEESNINEASSEPLSANDVQMSPVSAPVPVSSPGSPPVWEPILCGEAEDGQAPLSLDSLYANASVAGPDDAVMVAAHVLMLEAGFSPQDPELPPSQMPAGWRSSGAYRLQYTHPLCGGSAASVVAVVMAPMLVINATLKVSERVCTVRKLELSACNYVTPRWAGGAAAAFRNLKKLSRVFKDQLAYPLIAAAREAMALPVAFGLPALPPELLLRVLRLLDVRSLLHLSAVSRHFHAAANDSSLWRLLFRQDFPEMYRNKPRDSDWKKLYKQSYVSRPGRFFMTPPFMDRQGFFPVPRPFLPVPGIIGGEYDQRPHPSHFLLPRPRFDPIGPLADPHGRPWSSSSAGPGNRSVNIRRGFI